MRVTNQMMTNSMLYNINKNKTKLSELEEQYSSGKKIQSPSDDPIVAVRALRLRTNLSQLNQYYEKNIPDAYAWMDVTESALTNINTILSNINTACVQGSSDTLTASDRTSIVQNLQQYVSQIAQEGDSDYAGRYVFTGYKTDTSLTFSDYTDTLDYKITENFSGSDIDTTSVVTGSYSLDNYNTDPTQNDFSKAPTLVEAHRIRLSYDNLKDNGSVSISYSETDSSGNVTKTVVDTTGTKVTVTDNTGTVTSTTTDTSKKIVLKSSTDSDTYSPGSDSIYLNTDTGELVLGDNVYENYRTKKNIAVTYEKSEFEEGDFRPEHYFNCTVTDNSTSTPTTVTYKKEDQEIQYEVNFGQKLTVNTQASDAITQDIGRDIDEILSAAQDVTATESKISKVEEMLKDTTLTDAQTESLESLKTQLETELSLKNDILQKKFETGITGSKNQQETVNIALADLGSRYKRLQLTESRLSDQQVQYEDLLSKNEDADVVETYINLSAAEQLYNASLSATAKIAKNTLLDFL